MRSQDLGLKAKHRQAGMLGWSVVLINLWLPRNYTYILISLAFKKYLWNTCCQIPRSAVVCANLIGTIPGGMKGSGGSLSGGAWARLAAPGVVQAGWSLMLETRWLKIPATMKELLLWVPTGHSPVCEQGGAQILLAFPPQSPLDPQGQKVPSSWCLAQSGCWWAMHQGWSMSERLGIS